MNPSKVTRRNLLASASTLAAIPVQAVAKNSGGQAEAAGRKRPNILLVISDQFRADNLGCLGNPMGLTPNLDAMARRGTIFRQAMTNQPVCAPARGILFTGQYPQVNGVWRNGLGLRPGDVTLPKMLRQEGYTADYIGKWHLAPKLDQSHDSDGPVPPQYRGGFDDFWEGANALELVSHSFEGEMYDGNGKPLRFADQYRADFLTDRAVRFLKERQTDKPFFLTVSYLEVHHQNDLDKFVPPKKYEGSYRNCFVPQDLRPIPGSWPSQIADYYACVKGMDDCIGTLLATLKQLNLDQDTVVMFTSDHGCHFKTRNAEYKRSAHDSSIRIPLILQGPGFNKGTEVSELVSHIDVVPTLLGVAGREKPANMPGFDLKPLAIREAKDWRNEVYIEMSESTTGRVIRTPQHTYAVAFPAREAASNKYYEYMLYDNYADPFQHVNLVSRADCRELSQHLRERLIARMVEASNKRPTVEPNPLPYVC